MKEFSTPLKERLRLARIQRERYRTDPEFRLRSLNRARASRGLKPRQSVDEILCPDDVKAVLRELAKNQERDERGRFT
jgi:hypothetical protein